MLHAESRDETIKNIGVDSLNQKLLSASHVIMKYCAT